MQFGINLIFLCRT